jgi:hypothetical protein
MQLLIAFVLSCVLAIAGTLAFAFLCSWTDTGPFNAWAFWHGWVLVVFPGVSILSFRRLRKWLR